MDRRQILELSAALPLGAALAGAAGPARAAEGPSAEVRAAIQDTQSRFVWGLDNADMAMAAGAFSRDATVRDIEGRLWRPADGGAPAFLRSAIRAIGPGGSHYIQLNKLVAKGSAFVATTYWSRLSWTAGAPAPAMQQLGLFTDTFVRDGQHLRIAEKVITRWDSTTVSVAKL